MNFLHILLYFEFYDFERILRLLGASYEFLYFLDLIKKIDKKFILIRKIHVKI